MWQVIYIASTRSEAKRIKYSLTREGFLVKIEVSDGGNCQIKVPETEAEDVYQYLLELE